MMPNFLQPLPQVKAMEARTCAEQSSTRYHWRCACRRQFSKLSRRLLNDSTRGIKTIKAGSIVLGRADDSVGNCNRRGHIKISIDGRDQRPKPFACNNGPPAEGMPIVSDDL